MPGHSNPTRFIFLVLHIILLYTTIWYIDENVNACLPSFFGYSSTTTFEKKKDEMTSALYIGIFCLLFEFISFVMGLSAYVFTQTLISIICHCTAVIALYIFIMKSWDCDLYWWINASCTIFPAATEFLKICTVVILSHN